MYIYITKSLDVYCGVLGPDTFCSSCCCCERPKWDNPGLPGKTLCAMGGKESFANLELRCVKMRRIGSRVNVYTNV